MSKSFKSAAGAAKEAGYKIPKRKPGPGPAHSGTEEVKPDKKRNRSQPNTGVDMPTKKPKGSGSGEAYDPRGQAAPLGARSKQPSQPQTPVSSDEEVDDLQGVARALADMDGAARRKNFEIAIKNMDEMALVYARTEEEMRQAKSLLQDKVGLISWSSSYPRLDFVHGVLLT